MASGALILPFSLDIGEVFYIPNLASVPSTSVYSLPTPGEFSYYSIECVAYNFTAFPLRCLHFFVGSGAYPFISPS